MFDDKIEKSRKVLRLAAEMSQTYYGKPLIVTYSGGKDSDVLASDYDNSFIYKIGEIVSVDDFYEDRWNECSTGIHFFINRQEAVDYI